jgi:hypothetical protein
MPFFFSNIGPPTYIAAGETQYWHYEWPDLSDQGLVIAGPDLERYGSYGGEMVVSNQGKKFQLNEPGGGTHYYVTITNAGPSPILYNLQVGGFK